MSSIASIGTYVPCLGVPGRRVAGDDEDAVTPAASVYLAGVELPVSPAAHERVLAKVTGADPDPVDIGERGRRVLRRIAMRQGVADYGYAFQPESEVA